MLKCEVYLDNEKIIAYDIYTPDEIHSKADKVYNRFVPIHFLKFPQSLTK